jgi:hypothetical protein
MSVLQQTLYIALFAISFSINSETDELKDSKASSETTQNNAILRIMTHYCVAIDKHTAFACDILFKMTRFFVLNFSKKL